MLGKLHKSLVKPYRDAAFTWEHEFHRYLRRTYVLDRLLGDWRTLEREIGATLMAGGSDPVITKAPTGDFVCSNCQRMIPIEDGEPMKVSQVKCGRPTGWVEDYTRWLVGRVGDTSAFSLANSPLGESSRPAQIMPMS